MDPVTATATPETPAPPPSSTEFSLRAFREGKPQTPAAPVEDVTPDPEIEADPDLKSEIDKIEPPKPEETPAEKAARTRRHKAAAQQGAKTRLQNDRDRLRRENEDLRRQVAAPTTTRTEPLKNQPPAEARPDPNDPEPVFGEKSLQAFMEKNPDHPDPYAGALSEHNRKVAAWDRRQEIREAAATRQAEDRRAADDRTTAKLRSYATAGAAKHQDYDETVGALDALLGDHPANRIIAEFSAESKAEAEFAYQLGKNLDGLSAALRAGPARLMAFLGATEATVLASAKAAPAPPPITAAPTPHTPVGAGASANAGTNPAARPGTNLSLRELREWEKAHGRRS